MEKCSSDDLNLFDTVAASDHTVTMSCCDPVNWLSNVLQAHKTVSKSTLYVAVMQFKNVTDHRLSGEEENCACHF